MTHRSNDWTSIGRTALVAVWLASGCAAEPTRGGPSGAAGTGGSAAYDARPEDIADEGDAAPSFPRDLPRSAEMYWLTQIGWGRAQTDRVCARGRQDPVARALCAYPALSSLEDMLRAFWPAGRMLEENYTFGVNYHSAALASRFVSAVNPVVVITSLAPYDDGEDAGERARAEFTDLAISFARGDQLVELMGIDIPNQRVNFIFSPSVMLATCPRAAAPPPMCSAHASNEIGRRGPSTRPKTSKTRASRASLAIRARGRTNRGGS
jgi:hypothetical protein